MIFLNKDILLSNIDKIHTTGMGIDRIKMNLKLDTNDVVEFCKNKILDNNCDIYKQGKNWYCEEQQRNHRQHARGDTARRSPSDRT